MKTSDQASKPAYHVADCLWNIWCIASVVGIWPRYIEPNLLRTTYLNIPIKQLPEGLQGFKILHFSDLHLHKGMSVYFLNKLADRIKILKPDLIAFTGDFLCYSQFADKERLASFLRELSAPYGCFAVLGNHDYAQTVGINDAGDYDQIDAKASMIGKGFKRLASTVRLSKKVTDRVKAIDLNEELISFLEATPFRLLNNTTVRIPVGDTFINICGLGEYTMGRCLPDKAFANYDAAYPGIVLLHNPDGFPLLKEYPGQLVLSGHTHGGQINLPWMWKKFTLLENMEFKKGLKHINNKWLYISRGVGSVMSFRWFATPEIELITLEKQAS